ncbi:methylenetetrahydrofolate reductase (NADPH) [Rubricella aquisinus]|uniref:Methylenetetrahydrofolate reductase n=1 Tax=Rubricella aquisinus TaxID=2028108 RepID=A0A840WIF8_9RHOB|nr:methylenetetrahydrofolate reductase [NAD(P)H] [Rubricella aquisinus]MBB5514908.1 methylenetetrahydrofolate reductase (NADPH) [Rubricella aquisinus]
MSARDTTLSFEFFPPHSPEATMRLWASVERLAPLGPQFVSVTYGAGGTTRDRTRLAIATIRERARLNVAGHLTCVGASRAETLAVAEQYRKAGVTRIVALRGDAPKGADKFEPHPDGFSGAAELVSALREMGDWQISVAAYPEAHPEATSMEADIEHLKRKIDAGADSAITQFFFENDVFYRFRDKCAAAGITAPILPGILPVEHFGRMCKFAARCQADVPEWMHSAFGNCKDEEEHALLATAIATEQCTDLMANGVSHLHFYTLNKPDLTFNICQALGFEAQPFSMAQGAAG